MIISSVIVGVELLTYLGLWALVIPLPESLMINLDKVDKADSNGTTLTVNHYLVLLVFSIHLVAVTVQCHESQGKFCF